MKFAKTLLLVCMSLCSSITMAQQSDVIPVPENWRVDIYDFSILSNYSLSGYVTEYGAELATLQLRGDYVVTTKDRNFNVISSSEILSNRNPNTPSIDLLFSVEHSSTLLNECVKLSTDSVLGDLKDNKIHMIVTVTYLANTDAPANFSCGTYVHP
jgi:hypothetical protein